MMKSIGRLRLLGSVLAARLTAIGAALAVFSGSASAEYTGYNYAHGVLIYMAAPGSVATYYFTNNIGWGAPGCPNAGYAYFYSDRVGAKEMFAQVMQLRQLGKRMYFGGTCNGTSYFQVTDIASYE